MNLKGEEEPILAKNIKVFSEGRRMNRCPCDQNEILGYNSALSSGHCWAPANSGESQKLLWLGCRRKQTSPTEKGKSQGCCLVVPEIEAKPASRQISTGARELAGWRSEGQPRTLWSCGQLGWRFLSPCKVSRPGSVASSQMLRQRSPMWHPTGSSLEKGELYTGKIKGNYESFKILDWASKRSSWDCGSEPDRLFFFSFLPTSLFLSFVLKT